MRKKVRPDTLRSITPKIQTGHGLLYLTISYKVKGKPFEIIANFGKPTHGEGKATPCLKAWAEGLTRVISAGIQHGVPAEVLIEELKGLSCEHQVADPHYQTFIKSPVEAIYHAVKEFHNV